MKKLVFTLLILVLAWFSHANSIFYDSFEYANHDGETPIGWGCNDNSWKAGYLAQSNNRIPHSGNWYAYTEGDDSWLFMELYMSDQLKYRYSLWAISDGEYDIEIWAGNGPSSSQMTYQLFTETVSGGEYTYLSEYVQTIPSNLQYFGIHAVAHDGAACLTIDDINVDMVERYSIAVNPSNVYTTTAPGSQVEFNLAFFNLGYDVANVIASNHSDYFTNVRLTINGSVCTNFQVNPDESIEISGVATLLPEIEMGSTCWVDIVFDLDCSCASAMFTLWAVAGNESVDEYNIDMMSVYPNPSKGMLTIEADGLVTITDILGREVYRQQVIDKEIVMLNKGIYFVRKDDGQATKIIVE